MPSCALVLTLFLFQKGRAFFPSLPIAALLRCQLGGGGAEIVQVEMLLRRMAGLAAPKASVVLEPMLAFVASHEACRRMAVCTRQQTENYTRPASRGTRCATAVKPSQPACPSTPLRAHGAQKRVQGFSPACGGSRGGAWGRRQWCRCPRRRIPFRRRRCEQGSACRR